MRRRGSRQLPPRGPGCCCVTQGRSSLLLQRTMPQRAREIKHPVRKISKKYQPRSLTLWTPMKGTILVPLHNQHRIYVEEEVSFLSLPWSCPLFFCTYSVVFLSSVTKGDRYLQPELRSVNLSSMTWTMKMRTGLMTSIMSGRI